MGKDEADITFVGVIFNHLVGFIRMAYLREDMTVLADSFWAMLDPWVSDDLRKFWRIKCSGNSYEQMVWRVRICILALYNIEAISSSNTLNPKETLVFYKYHPYKKRGDSERGIKISERMRFGDLIMRYYYLLTELVQEGSDLKTMQYMTDIGYAFCTPYLSWEEQEEWKEAEEMMSPWMAYITKLRIITNIFDRESILFQRRMVDMTTEYEESIIDPLLFDGDFQDFKL